MNNRIPMVVVALLQLSPCGHADSTKVSIVGKASATSGAVVVRSYPPGMEAFVAASSALAGNSSDVAMYTKEPYRVGVTPLEVNLEPGEYVVTVKCRPMEFRADGEDTTVQKLKADGSGFEMVAKVYKQTVKTSHKALVVALFWSKAQSLEAFVRTLPAEQLLPRFTMEGFKPTLESHKVPQKDWESLLTLFRTTGKAVWQAEDNSRQLLVYCTELAPETLIATRPPDE